MPTSDPQTTVRPPSDPPHARRIFVSIDVAAPIDRVWERTQTPDLHARWDLRFSSIRYLPRASDAEPQRFEYATRLGFGLEIRGLGETRGERDLPGGARASALAFWSDDRKSLIRRGSGFWKYLPLSGGGTRFFTEYDYAVRFGAAGRAVDRLAFRPLIGWATAWSFDRLRLWLERDVDPAHAATRAVVNAVARLALAVAWAYQGLVPKLLTHDRDETVLFTAAGVGEATARLFLNVVGVGELLVALLVLLGVRAAYAFTLLAMPLAIAVVALTAPQYLTAAFNPVTMNAAIFALAAVAWLTHHDRPRAGNCTRRLVTYAPG